MLLNHMTVPERGFSGFLPEFAKEDAMRATIKIIAERAGVSIGTVDRVLNHRGSVNPADRKKKYWKSFRRWTISPTKPASFSPPRRKI